MTNTAGLPRKPESWSKGLRTVDPGVIDERAFMNAIRNARWLPENLRAFVREIDYNLAALPDRPLRRRAIASIGSDTQGKYSVPAEGYETESLLAAKRHRGRARRTFVRF